MRSLPVPPPRRQRGRKSLVFTALVFLAGYVALVTGLQMQWLAFRSKTGTSFTIGGSGSLRDFEPPRPVRALSPPAAPPRVPPQLGPYHRLAALDIDKRRVQFAALAGRVVLVVNVASA